MVDAKYNLYYIKNMLYKEFENLVESSRDRAVIVDVWAPWCGPCKAMKPVFEKLSREYDTQANVVALNADESPEVVEQLRITGIPTVLVFRQGSEVARRMGAQGESELRTLFEAAIDGKEIPKSRMWKRIVPLAGAALAMGFAGEVSPAWPLQLLAVTLFMVAIHDRCPIIQALKRTFTKTTTHATSDDGNATSAPQPTP